MKHANVSVMKQEPAARFTLLVSGALQATLATAVIATSTMHYVESTLFMVLGGVGLAYVAFAVAGRLPDGCHRARTHDDSGEKGTLLSALESTTIPSASRASDRA